MQNVDGWAPGRNRRRGRPLWNPPCTYRQHEVLAGVSLLLARVRCAAEYAHLSRAAPAQTLMAENRVNGRRRAGRPPAGAREGEKVKDYPQLSIRVPVE